MGALCDAIASAAKGFGAEIRTDAPVASIRVEDGRATGVVLESGEELAANTVVSNADPRTTFGALLDTRMLGAKLQQHLERLKCWGGSRFPLAACRSKMRPNRVSASSPANRARSAWCSPRRTDRKEIVGGIATRNSETRPPRPRLFPRRTRRRRVAGTLAASPGVGVA